MFDALTDRLGNIFKGLRGRGKIAEDNMAEATVKNVYAAPVRILAVAAESVEFEPCGA